MQLDEGFSAAEEAFTMDIVIESTGYAGGGSRPKALL